MSLKAGLHRINDFINLCVIGKCMGSIDTNVQLKCIKLIDSLAMVFSTPIIVIREIVSNGTY